MEAIKAIWVDDQCLERDGQLSRLGEEIVNLAGDKGIDITPCTRYDEAYKIIISNPYEWIACILDIRNEYTSAGEAEDGFTDMKNKLERLNAERKVAGLQELFIFVLSGFDQYANPLFQREEYASKKVYFKGTEDVPLLFEDLKKCAQNADLYRLKKHYSDVFNAVDFLEWENSDKFLFFKLLYTLDTSPDIKEANLMNDFRKLLEGAVMETLVKLGVPLPFDNNKDNMLNTRCKYIKDFGLQPVIPIYIQESFGVLSNLSSNGSHRGDSEEKKKKLIVDPDITNGNAPYLLRSCLFFLLNIVVWLKHFAEENRDRDTVSELFKKHSNWDHATNTFKKNTKIL